MVQSLNTPNKCPASYLLNRTEFQGDAANSNNITSPISWESVKKAFSSLGNYFTFKLFSSSHPVEIQPKELLKIPNTVRPFLRTALKIMVFFPLVNLTKISAFKFPDPVPLTELDRFIAPNQSFNFTFGPSIFNNSGNVKLSITASSMGAPLDDRIYFDSNLVAIWGTTPPFWIEILPITFEAIFPSGLSESVSFNLISVPIPPPSVFAEFWDRQAQIGEAYTSLISAEVMPARRLGYVELDEVTSSDRWLQYDPLNERTFGIPYWYDQGFFEPHTTVVTIKGKTILQPLAKNISRLTSSSTQLSYKIKLIGPTQFYILLPYFLGLFLVGVFTYCPCCRLER